MSSRGPGNNAKSYWRNTSDIAKYSNKIFNTSSFNSKGKRLSAAPQQENQVTVIPIENLEPVNSRNEFFERKPGTLQYEKIGTIISYDPGQPDEGRPGISTWTIEFKDGTPNTTITSADPFKNNYLFKVSGLEGGKSRKSRKHKNNKGKTKRTTRKNRNRNKNSKKKQ
jgi:hypothetical protein